MINIQKRKFVLGMLLVLTTSGWSYSQESMGREISVEYMGTRTTKELNQNKSCLINIESNASADRKVVHTIPVKKASSSHSHHNHQPHQSTNPIHRIGLNFTAATVADAPQTNVIPTNATGSIGDKQYILMSYQAVISFDRNTGNPDGFLNTDAASFFNGSAQDVRIDYDRFSRRWFASAELANDLVLAVSDDSLITDSTKWAFFKFPNAQIIPQITPLGSGFLDYQQLAIDRSAVYISVDTFDNLGDFLGTSSLVINKWALLDGIPSVTVFTGIVPESLAFGTIVPPADDYDCNSRFGYLAHTSNSSFGSGNTYNQFYIYRIVHPGGSHPTLSGPIAIEVPPYSDPSNAPHLGNLYGAAGFLQTGVSGGLMAPHVRNHQLFACHPILLDSSGAANPSGDRVGVRWYQFDLTGDTDGRGKGKEQVDTVPVLVQSGTLFDSTAVAPIFFYIPSIMTNKNLDLVISATTSGANNLTNVAFAGRHNRDLSGTLRTPLLLTANTTNPYNFGPLVQPFNGNIGQRWGDESSLSPDPVHDLDIWSTGQFAGVTNGWGIQVTEIRPIRRR
jgi:hypothetical protein